MDYGINKGGFTLAEVLVALMILAVMIPIITTMLTATIKLDSRGNQYYETARIMQSIMEEIKSYIRTLEMDECDEDSLWENIIMELGPALDTYSIILEIRLVKEDILEIKLEAENEHGKNNSYVLYSYIGDILNKRIDIDYYKEIEIDLEKGDLSEEESL